MFFSDSEKISHFNDVMQCDTERFNQFFHSMLASGINLAPSSFEAGFISSAHTDEDISNTVAAADKAFAAIA